MTERFPEKEWAGYVRPDGRVGIRNWCAIVGVDGLVAPLVQRLSSQLAQTVPIYTPFGRGQVGEDETISLRAFSGLASNPNIGSALVLGADSPSAETLAHILAMRGIPVATFSLQEAVEDTIVAAHEGMNRASDLIVRMTRMTRERVGMQCLTIGIECGHSDASSGLVANPVVGRWAEQLVSAGGTAIVGETYEWLGGEHVLARRAQNPEVADRIVQAVTASLARMRQNGRQWDNPGLENQNGGLTTIEEKALGAIAKSGYGPISGLLEYGEAPSQSGLFLMDTPFFTPESLTGMAAAGAQIIIMTTGAGNSFCQSVAPTIKVTANRKTAVGIRNQIDVDLSPVLEEPYDFEAGIARLGQCLLSVATGQLTRGEVIGESSMVVSRFMASV